MQTDLLRRSRSSDRLYAPAETTFLRVFVLNNAGMLIDPARSTLAVLVRRVTPDIVVLIAQEAARASGASLDERRSYEAFLSAAAAPILAVVEQPDAERERAFAAVLPRLALQRARVVPPVARVGLLEIGLRLARTEIARQATSDAERLALERELATLGDQLRGAVHAMCGAQAVA